MTTLRKILIRELLVELIQILQNEHHKIVWQTARTITNEILGGRVLLYLFIYFFFFHRLSGGSNTSSLAHLPSFRC